ncbi:MAG: hypothetical protein K8R48_09120 [Alphaproteobacteria bacterium]|nr:hypothetical protein [Alphaproteobacteria bacterium]
MSDTFKKPSPAQVLTEIKKQNQQVETVVKNSIENINAEFTTKVKTLDSEKITKLAEVSKAVSDEISASQQIVNEKEDAVKAALETLRKAESELGNAETAHIEKIFSLKQTFNKAAKELKNSFAADKAAADKARAEALTAEKKKVADAKKAGRSAVWAETKALVDYRIFVVKDKTVRVGHGFVAVAKALKTAFNAGYNAPTCITLPKSVAERQDKPANDQQQPQA